MDEVKHDSLVVVGLLVLAEYLVYYGPVFQVLSHLARALITLIID